MRVESLVLALLSVASIATARTNLCSCDQSVSVEWLYMFNTIDTPYFVEIPNGQRLANNTKWHSGYRVEGSHGICDDQQLSLRWTHLPKSTQSRTVTSDTDSLEPILGFPFSLVNFASVKDQYTFYDLEFLYSHAFQPSCLFTLWLEGGIQYAHLHFKEEARYANSSGGSFGSRFNSSFNGVGPQVGLEADYRLTRCLNVEGRAQAALLASRKKATSDVTSSIHPDDFWLLIPALDLRLGLNYSFCLCSKLFDLGIGYELMTYFRALERVDEEDTIQQSAFSDYMLQGLYLRAGFTF